MNIEKRFLKDLKAAEYNPRKKLQPGDADFEKIARSIEEFGYVDPIIINADGTIIGGHQRCTVLKHLGYEEAECVIVDVDKTKEKALNIALNKITGEWDEEKLKDLLIDLKGLDFEIDITGFNENDLSDLIGKFEIEKEITEDEFDIAESIQEIEKPKSKHGDIWILGNHKLMCGDSTDEEDVKLLIENDKINMIFTDPPYGMDLDTDFSSMKGFSKGNTYEKGYVDNFKSEMVTSILSIKASEIFIWGADYFSELIENRNKGSWIVWDKRANNNDDIEEDYSSDKMYGSCFELCWSKVKHKREIARIKWAGIFGLSQETDKKRVHPTQKPIKLCEWFFKKYSKENDVILDLFGGSGSTLIAAEQLRRKARIMELDEVYCDVIIKRWENYTGEKAVLLNG